MTLENIKLDINFVRSQFPAFDDPLSKDWAFFENAGGSYVPKNVIEHLTKFMTATKVQPYAEYPMSQIAGEKMDRATDLFAKIINAKNNEILIGGSTSINLYVLSNALKKYIKKNDEVIVTNQDHEANISPWRRLKENGAKIIEWKFNPDNQELEISELENLITSKTKILAVTHCSNIVGSVNNLKEISKLAHKNNIIVIGDGVSYAPHGFPNVKDLDVDFYTFSLYKTFGPHLALLYGKEEILKDLPNQNHEFLDGQYPYTINPGGPNHEELSSMNGIYEYLINLYNHHFEEKNNSIRDKVDKLNNIISAHEELIANPILEYLHNSKNYILFGKNKINKKNRAPTISFIPKKKSANFVAKKLIENNIGIRNDNFYAWRCLKALGVDLDDGVIRASLVHYNSINDTNKLIESLDRIN